jgi:hypothetical protein
MIATLVGISHLNIPNGGFFRLLHYALCFGSVINIYKTCILILSIFTMLASCHASFSFEVAIPVYLTLILGIYIYFFFFFCQEHINLYTCFLTLHLSSIHTLLKLNT